MNKLYVLCGIPASGKSTFVNTHKDYDTDVISRDNIRFSLLKSDEEYFSHENDVWNQYIAAIKTSLKWNKITYADATHLNKNSRNKLLKALGTDLNDIEVDAIAFTTPLSVCLERNNKREGKAKVPESAIKNMYKGYTLPSIDEGFNRIFNVDKDGNIKEVVEV